VAGVGMSRTGDWQAASKPASNTAQIVLAASLRRPLLRSPAIEPGACVEVIRERMQA